MASRTDLVSGMNETQVGPCRDGALKTQESLESLRPSLPSRALWEDGNSPHVLYGFKHSQCDEWMESQMDRKKLWILGIIDRMVDGR